MIMHALYCVKTATTGVPNPDTGATNPDTGNGRKTGEPKLEKPTIYGDVQLGGTSTKSE